MIPIDQVLALYRRLILEHGGSDGIRDLDALKSALNRPFQSFEGKALYPTALHKGGALIESLISNHPFVDGNKRTAYVLSIIIHSRISNSNPSAWNSEDQRSFTIKRDTLILQLPDGFRRLKWVKQK